jgi:hypothetical protein
MSLAGVVKRLRCFGVAVIIWIAVPAWSWAQQGCASCGSAPITCQSCQWLHCPPAYRHCQEGPPCIHWHCGCPHPVCNPCDLPHWGYFETCWYPWPYPPTQCTPPTPAQMVVLNPLLNPNMPPQDPRTPKMGGPSGVRPPLSGPIMLPPATGAPIDDLPPPRTLRP